MASTGVNKKSEIAKALTAQYGSDLMDLEKCREILSSLKVRKDQLSQELDLKNESSSVTKLIITIDDGIERIEHLLDKSKSVDKEIGKKLEKVDEVRKTVQSYFDKIVLLETTVQYMRVVQKIEYLSSELQKEVANKDDEKCATLFANLCEISRNLMGSKSQHLCNHLKETLHHWHNVLKDKFSHDYEEILKAIKWPFVNTNFSLQTPSDLNISKLQIVAEYLLQIELPEESTSPVVTSALLSDFPPLSLPIHFLVLPLRKRFVYHFYGTRQTNRPDKPEWYLTQILSWIRDHVEFVEKWIQPIMDKLGLHHIDARLELMRGLVQLAVEKMDSDIPNLQFDDFSFSHCVDEALGFDKELRETYDYPSTQPSILAVLTKGPVFVKWMTMEKKYATEKMDAMLSPSLSDAFQQIASDVEVDDVKITICADTFVSLLQTMTDRYESLPQPGHRLQFLELQLELLDDFRVRLLQLVNVETGDIIDSRIPMIINTIYYVENILVDWGSMLHFLNLYYYKTQLENLETRNCVTLSDFENIHNDVDTESIFSDILSLYRHMRKDLLCTLAETVIMEAKARSRGYRREQWSNMQFIKEMRSMSLTPSACPIFEVLARRLHQLQKSLAAKLFSVVWRYIAQQLDTFLFEDLVLDNRFNDGGAMQLKFDVTRNLFALFSQYSDKPESYFNQLNEACNLLNISKGSALLLRNTLIALEGATGIEDQRGNALAEIGVHNFTPKMAVTILNQRTDITVNRMSFD